VTLNAGPVQLREILNQVFPGNKSAMTRGSGPEEVYILGPEKIFPIDWRFRNTEDLRVCMPPPGVALAAPGSLFDRKACAALFPEAYAVSYWTHNWNR
jgi:hypothetical protein